MAFARLTGVRLFYQKAWRDNADKVFKDRGGFGLLDSYQFRDGRKGSRPVEDRFSEFRWNSVLFESFQSGYLKRLDYETVRALGTKAKRLYRYLDKHFNPPNYVRLAFDLRTLACEHLGLSRDYDATQIRRQLRPAIDELEEIGFVTAASDEQRYRKLGRGRWEVTFERATGKSEKAVGQEIPKTRAAQLGEPARKPPVNVSQPVDPDEERIQGYLKRLSASERAKLEEEAYSSADPFVQSQLAEIPSPHGPLALEFRRIMVRSYVLKKITDTVVSQAA